jgi:hypothetical protein
MINIIHYYIMFIGILFTIIHVLYMLTISMVILFSNNTRTLLFTSIILVLNHISIHYHSDCYLTLLENKYGICSLMDITKYTHIYHNKSISFSSTVATTLVTSALSLIVLKFMLLSYPKSQAYLKT